MSANIITATRRGIASKLQLLATLVVPASRVEHDEPELDDDGEQRRIVIGHRKLQRGQMLRAAAAQQQQSTLARVKIGDCPDCGVPGKVSDGVVIAQCSCANGAQRAFAMAPPSSVPTGDPGSFVANPPGGPIVVPDPFPGCFPQALCDRRTMRFKSSSWGEMLRNSRMTRRPYEDPYYDSVWMDEIWSEPTTVAAGATVDIELQPTAGTFALFYYNILAVDPTSQIAQVDWRAARPRIEGCPVPCSTGDVAALAQFMMQVPEACCGKPLVAWIDEESRNTPLVTPFTNNTAGDLLVQIGGRGYCCNERVC